MIRNYIKTALRNIKKHRTLSLINILGLTTGLTAVILIGIYVRYEFSFDRFHQNADNIYRVERKGTAEGKSYHLPHTNNNIPPALKEEYPSINMGFNPGKVMVVHSNDRQFHRKMPVLKETLLQTNDISHITLADNKLGKKSYGDGIFRIKEKAQNSTENFHLIDVDEDFVSTMNMHLVAGRGFSDDFRSDRQGAFLINEAAIKKLGLSDPDDAVGKMLVQTLLENKYPTSLFAIPSWISNTSRDTEMKSG